MADRTVQHFYRREFLGEDTLDSIEVSFEDEFWAGEDGEERRIDRSAYVHLISDGDFLCFKSSVCDGTNEELRDFRERMLVVSLLLNQLLSSIDRVLEADVPLPGERTIEATVSVAEEGA